MNPDSPESTDERLGDLLADCDERRLAGDTPPDAGEADLPEGLRLELERDLVCVRLLHELLQRPGTATGPPSEAVPDPSDQPPPMVQGYEMLGELGRGGMGVVYKARQLGLEPRRGPEDDPGRRPRRAGRAGPLPHRGRGGRPAAAPQHRADLRGRRARRPAVLLAGVLRRRQPGPEAAPARRCRREAAAPLVETLARAVQAAHEQGIVHRDLKPANVLLADDGTPKITDFGLAKTLDERPGQTQTGAIMGTPSYMAPEQAAGDGQGGRPGGGRLCAGGDPVRVLTGRPPFKAATALDTLQQVIERGAGAAVAAATRRCRATWRRSA